MSDTSLVPADFVPPETLETPLFRLEPLGPQHNASDYAAWSTSRDHIHATPGWESERWPDDRSIDDNLRDLVRHAADFAARRGFTYTVLDPATSDVIGCVYLYPDEAGSTQAVVQSWVRAGSAELDIPLWEAVSGWLASSWPFATVAYAERTPRT